MPMRVMESPEAYGVDLDALRLGLKDSPAKRLERADENARDVAALRQTAGVSFASILQGLNSAKVRFVLIGGLAAAAHGSRRVIDHVAICYDSSPANLKQLTATLAGWDAYPRGLLDVMDIVKGVGDFKACLARSITISAFDVRLRVLDLAALIDAKRAAGRPRDLDHIPELEALLALKG